LCAAEETKCGGMIDLGKGKQKGVIEINAKRKR